MQRAGTFAIFLVMSLFWLTILPAEAQSVRPPDNAVVQSTPEAVGPSNTLGKNSVSKFWHNLRKGSKGLASDGPRGATLIQSQGEDWRLIRQNYILRYSGWILLAALAIIAVFFLVRGRIRVKAGRSGELIERFSISQRSAHWFMAFIFLFLAFSGLYILLGRTVFLPFLGHSVNSIMTSAAMQGHNLFGPIFIFALAWLYYQFVPGNFLKWIDLKWIVKGGGFFGGHVSSWRYNFGEKIWFWLVAIIGLFMSISGLVMEFPWLTAELNVLQLSSLVHVGGAIVLISVAIGHIYIGTVGMEGSLEGMRDGHVDGNWAKEHHDLWYEQMTSDVVIKGHEKTDTIISTSRRSQPQAGE